MNNKSRFPMTVLMLAILAVAGCDDSSDDGAGGMGGGEAGMAGGHSSGGAGQGGSAAGGANGGTGGTDNVPPAAKGISFDRQGPRADSSATATLQDDAIAVVNLRANAPGLMVISLVRNPGPFKTGAYLCGESATISYSVQGDGYSSDKGECKVTVQSFAGAGQPMVGTFSATLKNDDGTELKLTGGSFDVPVSSVPAP